VALLTLTGAAHLSIMGSRERLAATKVVRVENGAEPILNALDAESVARSETLAGPVRWFASTDGEPEWRARGDETIVAGDTLVVRDGLTSVRSHIDSPLPGLHNAANLAAAIAAARALEVSPDDIRGAVPNLTLPEGRYERRRVGSLDVIFDAYNASMQGSLATLAAFAREKANRRIAVLGSMAELGTDAPEMHERVGAAAVAAGIDYVLVGGDFADDLARGARGAGIAPARIAPFATNGDAAAWLIENARAGDLVLFKGSRRYRLEEILEALAAHG